MQCQRGEVGWRALVDLEGLCKGFGFCSKMGSPLEGSQQRRDIF